MVVEYGRKQNSFCLKISSSKRKKETELNSSASFDFFSIQSKVFRWFEVKNIMGRNNYTHILPNITGHLFSTVFYYETVEFSQVHISPLVNVFLTLFMNPSTIWSVSFLSAPVFREISFTMSALVVILSIFRAAKIPRVY